MGDSYMGIAATAGDATKVQILDSTGQVIADGAVYSRSMTYTAKLMGLSGVEWLTDFSSAATTTLGTYCNDTRVYQNNKTAAVNQDITFQVPNDFSGTYTVTFGYTGSSSSAVKVVSTTLVEGTSSSSDDDKPNVGMITGVSVGAFVFFVLCCFGGYYAYTHFSKSGEYNTANQDAEIGMQVTTGENGEEQVTGEGAEGNI